MARETEIKILEIDKQKIVARLEGLGARKVLEARLIIKEYDFSDGRLRNSDSSCRVRSEGDVVVACYKHRFDTQGYKVCDEHEVVVSSLEEMCFFLEGLGMELVGDKEKDRVSYVVDFRGERIRFDIDEWPRIPAYVEIEANSPFVIDAGVRLLGYSSKDMTDKTATEVLKRYGVRMDKKPVVLKF